MNTQAHKQRLQQLAQEIAEKRREMRALLQESARGKVANYSLLDSEGRSVQLSELFGDKDDLLVVHNMGASCPYCTLWADGFNGIVQHIENRTAFAVVSPDSPEQQRQFAKSRNWQFTMYSGKDSDFTRALGFSFEKNGQLYQLPGVSAFHKNADGSIICTGRDSFGPGDVYSNIWYLFELLEHGAANWEPQFQYSEQSAA